MKGTGTIQSEVKYAKSIEDVKEGSKTKLGNKKRHNSKLNNTKQRKQIKVNKSTVNKTNESDQKLSEIDQYKTKQHERYGTKVKRTGREQIKGDEAKNNKA